MAVEPTRSEAVIADFKRRKLARSAFLQIQELIQSFEDDRAFDRQMARIGVIIVGLLLVTTSIYFLFSGDSITLC